MRARQALTSSVDVTVPALMRADTSDSVSPASVSAGAAAARPRVAAAAAAPNIVTVNSRRERRVIGRYNMRFSRRAVGLLHFHIPQKEYLPCMTPRRLIAEVS